jgi:hypothetical protein
MIASRLSARAVVAMLVMAACFFTHPPAGAELSKRDIKALVTEYVNPDTDAARRLEVLGKLRLESRPALALEYIKTALKNDAERPFALDLATELRVEGLFKTLKKDIDGDDEDRIVSYCFATQDDGATALLFDRWKEKPVDEAAFILVKEGFAKWYVDLETIGKFREYIKAEDSDVTKRQFARLILLAQMDLPSTSKVDIDEAWKDFYVDHKTNSVAFTMVGRDVLKMTGWSVGGRTRTFGENYKLFPQSVMEFVAIPEEWQKANFSLKIGVRVTEGAGCHVGLGTDAGMFAPTVEGSNWTVKVGGGGSKSTKFKLGEWVTIEFDCTYRDKDTVDYRRDCIIRIGNEDVITNGLLTGKLEKILLLASDTSVFTIGGIEYTEKKKK